MNPVMETKKIVLNQVNLANKSIGLLFAFELYLYKY